jgi:putative transposase
MNLDRSMWYYQSVKDDREVEEKLREYAHKLPTRGLPEYTKRIRKEGFHWNHKRIRRVYKKLKLNKRRRFKRRIPNPEKKPLLQPLAMNLTWSMDFMEDRLENGRKFRILNIIDDFNREAICMEIGYSFPSVRVVQILKQVIEWRGKPTNIRTDNGTEFIANAFKEYCNPDNGINHIRIQKGKPNQNGFIERFNRLYREDVLDACIFEELPQAIQLTQTWMEDYNNNHPHKNLGDRSPLEFANAVNCGKLLTQNLNNGLPQLTAQKNKT